MIPSFERLREIAHLSSGDFGQIRFAVLLHALAVHQRNVVVEMRRGPIEKRVVIEKGVPIDCRSNLAHETLGRFLMSQGKLREEDMTAGLARSASLGQPLGQVLLEQELLTAFELFRFLQQNLARKLLDAFTWREGTFELSTDVPPADSTLKIKPAQLVVTGVLKFAPQEEVDSSIVPLIGRRLALHPAPVFALDEIRLSGEHNRVVERLAARGRIDEIAAATEIPYEEIGRVIYALAILGIVVTEDQIPKDVEPKPASKAPAPAQPQRASTAMSLEDDILRNEFMQIFLSHRGRDAFDLLSLPDTATEEEIRKGFVDFAKKVAPWRFESAPLEQLRDKAEEVFLTASRAYAELSTSESRLALVHRRRTLREEQKRATTANRFAIKTDLLDPEVQYRKGKTLLDAGKFKEALTFLEFAVDCDAQNSTYGSELAWCRFLFSPVSNASAAMKSLREIIRIDPEAGGAYYYAGEIARQRGDAPEAEKLLRKAAKLLGGDRRPMESLKLLLTKR